MTATNEIYNTDCIEGMKKIEDHSIDMILCDPPYGRTKCEWDTPLNLKDLWEEYRRIAKETAAIIIFGKQPFTSEVIMSNKEMFRYELIWEKTRAGNNMQLKRQPAQIHENIMVFYKRKSHTPKSTGFLSKTLRIFTDSESGRKTSRRTKSWATPFSSFLLISE